MHSQLRTNLTEDYAEADQMDAEFVLTLASQSWLKWFYCPNCGSGYPTSINGRCAQCNEKLVLAGGQAVRNDILNDFPDCLISLIPWLIGSSTYYHTQWNKLASPIIEIDNS